MPRHEERDALASTGGGYGSGHFLLSSQHIGQGGV